MSHPFEHLAAALFAVLLTTMTFVAVVTVPETRAAHAAPMVA